MPRGGALLGARGQIDVSTADFVEMGLLPDFEKERLCRELLEEFGAVNVKSNSKGELIHSCCLPYGLHANGDRSPSASLNYQKLTYNCYGCGGGGLLWFIATCRGTSSADARRWLANETGTGAEEQTLASLLEFFDAVYAQRPEMASPIPTMDARLLEPYRQIHPYMTENRHCPMDSLIAHNVGYGEFRMNLGTMESPRWVTSPRIVLPHFWKGKLVGWQSRRLLPDGTPKYHNTPDFPKDTTLYDYDPKQRVAIVVESVLSILRHSHRHHMVGTFGASVTERQMRFLSHYERVVLWMDNDNAGWRATAELGEWLESYMPVYVAPSPWAADPGDMDEATVDEILADATPFALWTPPSSLQEWKG